VKKFTFSLGYRLAKIAYLPGLIEKLHENLILIDDLLQIGVFILEPLIGSLEFLSSQACVDRRG
jgi:hypothetical protein